jgi:hypothetical protein
MKSTKTIKNYIFLQISLFACLSAVCQPKEEYIKVIVAPEHSDWNYAVDLSGTAINNGKPADSSTNQKPLI